MTRFNPDENTRRYQLYRRDAPRGHGINTQ
jgi:hypothetical protein